MPLLFCKKGHLDDGKFFYLLNSASNQHFSGGFLLRPECVDQVQ